MPPTTRLTLTVSDTDHDLGHGSRPRRHPSDTHGKGQYFHGIDDHGRKSLWFAPETLGSVHIGHRVQITTREWNDPRLGLARPHALVTLDHVRAPLPAWCRLETPIALLQRALGAHRNRLHRQVLADWLADGGYPVTATLVEAIRLSLKTPETFFLPYPQRLATVPFTCAWNGWLLGSPSDNPQDLIQHLWLDRPERLDPPRRQGRYPVSEPNTTRLRSFRELWRWIDRNHPTAGFSLTSSIADRIARSSKRPNYWTDWSAYLKGLDILGQVEEALARPNLSSPRDLHFQLSEQAVRGYLNQPYGQLSQQIDNGTFRRDASHGIDHTEVERFRENRWVVEDLR